MPPTVPMTPPFKSPPVADLLTDWPDPIIEPNFNFDNCADWSEETGGQDAPYSISMSPDTASVPRVGVVPWRRLYACFQAAIGVNYVDFSFPTVPRLRRVLPNQHPLLPQMRCVKIASATPFSSTGRTWQALAERPANQGGPTYQYISDLPEFDPTQGGFRPAGDFGVYEKVRVALEYAPIIYQLGADTPASGSGPAQDEEDRFTFPYTEVQNIVLTIEGGQFVWWEGPGSTGGPVDPVTNRVNAKLVNAKLNKIIETQGVRIVWHRVPHEWVHDLSGVLRVFARLQGTVNKDYFFGFPPQTLRLLAPKKSPPRVEPCWVRKAPSAFAGSGESPHRLQLSYDIEIICQYFDPIPGISSHINPDPNTGLPLNPAPPLAGHNLALYGGQAPGTTEPAYAYYGVAHRSTSPYTQGGLFVQPTPKPFNEVADWSYLFRYVFAKDSTGQLNL